MNRLLSILFGLAFLLAGQSRIQAEDPAFGRQPNIILMITDDQSAPISVIANEKPNIVYIICDDHRYGHIHCLAPETSKIPTPNVDKLASQGMIFTDAHSGSSVCTPTRYGLMTGRYSRRTRLQRGIVTAFAPCLIAKGRPTVASFLKSQGYHTGIIGKWHLNFQYFDPHLGVPYLQTDHKVPSVNAMIPDGPLHRGFDYFHGFHHSRNMEAVIENDRVVEHDDVINIMPRLTKKPVATSPGVEKKDRPNILFIIADDQSPFDLKVYNPKSRLETPTIDRLAREGMTFDRAYHMGSWSGAVCTPSRRMIMSGRTVWHLPGGNPNAGDLNLVPANLAENTMAAIFNRAGYDTMRTCKKGNSYPAANEKFRVRHDSTKRGATDETGSAWHAEQVLNFLGDRQANNDRDPFLIYFGFSHPHDPRNGNIDLLAKYGAVNHTDKDSLPPANPRQPPLPVNYLAAHPFHHGHPGLRDEVSVSGVWKKRDERTISNELGREFACGENIDIQIGRVLKKLDEMGELDNTYIFYTSDHGIAIGRHGLQGKQNLYEHTWRVPFIVRGPGIQAGSRAGGNIYLLDVLGTICDLADIEAPKTVESKSLRPVLEGKRDSVRKVVYGTYSGGTKPGMRSVRQGDWKLIKYDVLDGKVRQTQLFNLTDNPGELLKEHQDPNVIKLTANTPNAKQVNLADDPKFANQLAEMEALLLSEMRRLDDPYRLWDQPDDGLTPPPSKSRKKTAPKSVQ